MKLFFILIAIILYLIKTCRGNVEGITNELMSRFDADSKTPCFDHDGKRLPLYGCVGIIIRGRKIRKTNPDRTIHVWSHNRDDSISAGFLHKDSIFSVLGHDYDSGLILYPLTKTPDGMNRLKVLCAFPVNGWTDTRQYNHGCTGTRCHHICMIKLERVSFVMT